MTQPQKKSPWIVRTITAVTGPWTRQNLFAWVKLISLLLLIQWLLVQPFKIPSGSMEPTLHGDPRFFWGDRVAVNKWIFGIHVPFMNKRIVEFQKPKRWDIVVFRSVDKDDPRKILIKRLVGLPGERVRVGNDGELYINGKLEPKPSSIPDVYYTGGMSDEQARERENQSGFVIQPNTNEIMKFGVLPSLQYSQVPEGHYFMLGDNSAHSRDGRYFGWVPEDHILGRAACIWWPYKRWRDFTGFSATWWGKLMLFGLPLALLAYEVSHIFYLWSLKIRHTAMPSVFAKGDRIVVNRMKYGLHAPLLGKKVSKGRKPQRDEIVVYTCPDGTSYAGAVVVGRVAAKSGDTVRVEKGQIQVNGSACGPLGSGDDSVKPWLTSAQQRVPERHYLVLVDEPEDGADSRTLGWIPEDNFIGPVTQIWWPPSRRKVIGAGAAGKA